MLAQGNLLGFGQAAMVVPATAAVSQHLQKRRGVALGFTVAGSSIGGIILPIGLSKMLNGSNLGFGWSVQIIGFILILHMLTACLTIRARHAPYRIRLSIREIIRINTYTMITVSMFIILLGMYTPVYYLPSFAWTSLIGFTSGTILSAAAASFTICVKDRRQIGVYMGVGMAIASLASLIGPPINGVLLREDDGFTPLSIFSGVACIMGGL